MLLQYSPWSGRELVFDGLNEIRRNLANGIVKPGAKRVRIFITVDSVEHSRREFPEFLPRSEEETLIETLLKEKAFDLLGFTTKLASPARQRAAIADVPPLSLRFE